MGLGGPEELTPERLRELLLKVFPESVVAGREDVPTVLEVLRRIVAYLGETGAVTADAAAGLEGDRPDRPGFRGPGGLGRQRGAAGRRGGHRRADAGRRRVARRPGGGRGVDQRVRGAARGRALRPHRGVPAPDGGARRPARAARP